MEAKGKREGERRVEERAGGGVEGGRALLMYCCVLLTLQQNRKWANIKRRCGGKKGRG